MLLSLFILCMGLICFVNFVIGLSNPEVYSSELAMSIFCGPIMWWLSYSILKEMYNDFKNSNNKDYLINELYEECERNGVHGLSAEKDRQRVRNILQKTTYKKIKNLSIEELEREFEELKVKKDEEVKKLEIQKERDRIAGLKEEERKVYNELVKYAKYSKKSKRKIMLTDYRELLKKEAEKNARFAEYMMYYAKKPEMDWAVHGGIASGIAGPAAGIATAINVEAKNAQIRLENYQNMKAVIPSSLNYLSQASELSKQVEKIDEELKKIDLILIDESFSQKELLENICFGDFEIEVSETGAFVVKVKARAKGDFVIFEDVPAGIDGIIDAVVYKGEEVIGKASLVTPIYGITSMDTVELQGICLSGAKQGEKYSVKFEPKDIWAIEIGENRSVKN